MILQKITKRTKIQNKVPCRKPWFPSFPSVNSQSGNDFTEDNQENEDLVRDTGKIESNSPLQRNVVLFAWFRSVRARQDHTGDAVLQHRLMEIHQQSHGNIEQLHVAEELRFAGRMHDFDSL